MKENWIEFKSDIDEDTFFLANNTRFKKELEIKYPNRAIYLPYEIPFMRKLDNDTKKKVHIMKKQFGGLIIDYMKK